MMKPPGEGPPPHSHGDMEEAFYILEGAFTFTVGSEQVEARAGSFLLVPRGTMHAFWNSGSDDGRYLRIFSPPLSETAFRSAVELGERIALGRERNEGTTRELFLREVARGAIPISDMKEMRK